jgi:hypothetical protein
MSRASDAHSSPLRNAGVVLSFGCVEKRAETAQTANINTGGTVPALPCELVILTGMEYEMLTSFFS